MLATDVDGTLLNDDGTLSEENARAVAMLIAHGVPVTLATGRTEATALPLARTLGLRVPLVLYNGAVVATPQGRVLRQTRLAPEAVDQAIELAARVGLQGFVYLSCGLVPVLGGEALAGHLLPEDRSRLLDGPAPWTREGGAIKVLWLGVPQACDVFVERAQELRAMLRVIRSGPQCVEVLAPGVSKASGLAHVLGMLGLRAREMVAVGNAENDLEMLRMAGAGVAVASAEPAVIRHARYVAPAHTRAGVAAVARGFFPHLPWGAGSGGCGAGAPADGAPLPLSCPAAAPRPAPRSPAA